MEWWKERVFYQIYPLGFCGAERVNDFQKVVCRLDKIEEDIPRIKSFGFGAVLLNPLFKSSSHGYDTADFFEVDNRLGNNADFKRLVEKFHEADIKVVCDAVFNHVGRDFPRFKDVKQYRESSWSRDFFHIDFASDSPYGDGFRYEGWEGHYDLVKLNLGNRAVVDEIKKAVRFWVEEFGIDGLRLDVGYMLPEWFIRETTDFCRSLKSDFFIVAEAIHGDYNRLMNCGCSSVTNYECYKGLHSAINSRNLFEIEHSLSRQFADTAWALYKGKHLFNFLDNHDVPRIYTVLSDKRNVCAAFAVLTVMPGIPCIYYGSEYGAEGAKGDADIHLRPAMESIDKNAHTDITDTVKRLIAVRNSRMSLKCGSYEKAVLSNEYFCIKRSYGEETTYLAANISDGDAFVNVGRDTADLLSGENCGAAVTLKPHSFRLLGA